MSQKKLAKLISKYFRVAVEGGTVDGREITRQEIIDMGADYSKDTYGARVWMEHLRSYTPESPFRAYGDIASTKSEEIKSGPHKGKMGLYAQIEPLPDLVKMNQDGQKIYTSVEIHPSHPTTGKAYLMGLAVTDSPASVGTEVLKFSTSKQKPDHILLSSEDEIDLEFEEIEVEEEKPSVFSRVKEMFSKKDRSDEKRFNDLDEATIAVAEKVAELEEEQKKYADQSEKFKALETELEQYKTAFNELKAQLDKEEKPPKFTRKPATGGNDQIKKPLF